MMRFFKPRCSAFSVAGAALLALIAGRAGAQVIVAEDFLYQQETNIDATFTSENKLQTLTYGGGQNGVGTWDQRWTGFGGGGIVSDDLENEPFVSNPFTARVAGTQEGSNGSELARDYSLGSAASTTTLWFAADFLLPSGDAVANYASFSPLGTIAGRDPFFLPAVEIGIKDGTFFGSIGDAEVLGDFTGADDVTDLAFHRVVGKVELGTGDADLTADYNGDGVLNAADYTIYRDTLGSTTDLRADGDGSGTIDQPDYDLWANGFGNSPDRLTVLIDPTGPDSSAGSTLVLEGEIARAFNENPALLQAMVTGVDPTDTTRSGTHLVDNLAIGLTYDDVAAVDVPRLSAEVGAGGAVSLVNDTTETFEIAYYELESAAGELTPDGWNSLEDQATTGFVENSSTAGLIVESSFTDVLVIGPGETIDLGTPANGTSDLIVRYGELEGEIGLLNLAPVVAASAAAVPEPSTVALLAIAALGFARKRN